MKLVEESALYVEANDLPKVAMHDPPMPSHHTCQALAKAQEAGVTERQLVKQREVATPDQINYDLTFSVLLHLGNIYQKSGMATEAIQTYNVLVKNKMFDRAGRVRINIGNIYFEQKKYLQAIKMYRMALDQIPAAQQELKSAVHLLTTHTHSSHSRQEQGDAQHRSRLCTHGPVRRGLVVV